MRPWYTGVGADRNRALIRSHPSRCFEVLERILEAEKPGLYIDLTHRERDPWRAHAYWLHAGARSYEVSEDSTVRLGRLPYRLDFLAEAEPTTILLRMRVPGSWLAGMGPLERTMMLCDCYVRLTGDAALEITPCCIDDEGDMVGGRTAWLPLEPLLSSLGDYKLLLEAHRPKINALAAILDRRHGIIETPRTRPGERAKSRSRGFELRQHRLLLDEAGLSTWTTEIRRVGQPGEDAPPGPPRGPASPRGPMGIQSVKDHHRRMWILEPSLREDDELVEGEEARRQDERGRTWLRVWREVGGYARGTADHLHVHQSRVVTGIDDVRT